MSFSKIVPGKYENQDALEKCSNYCAGNTVDYEKCEYWSGYGVLTTSIDAAINSMKAVKRLNYETDGKQLRHIVITIYKYEKVKSKKEYVQKIYSDNEYCNDIGDEVAFYICQRGYQTLYFKHIDAEYLHLHFVVNTVNFMNGCVLENSNDLKKMIDDCVRENFPYMQWEFWN